MVVFTCNNCGESLQKPKVEKHFQFRCRGVKNLTCVDCFKDFKGDEYVAHTKCVTENQRYGSKDYVEKAKKGEVKQESWMEMIKAIILHESNISASCKSLLNTICNYNNVPRKKQKFINFIKNSTGGRSSIGDIEAVWDLIEKHKTENAPKNGSDSTETNKRKLNEETTQPSKRIKSEDINGVKKENGVTNGSAKNQEEPTSFSWVEEILSVLNKKNSLTLAKLEKKVLKKYKEFYSDDINVDKFSKKFNKKLKTLENVELSNDNVIIKQ